MNIIAVLIDNWRKLQEARKNLNEFKKGNNGMNSTIIIRDAAGREFKTSQSIVFTTVLQTVQQVLDEKIAETEVQMDFASLRKGSRIAGLFLNMKKFNWPYFVTESSLVCSLAISSLIFISTTFA